MTNEFSQYSSVISAFSHLISERYEGISPVVYRRPSTITSLNCRLSNLAITSSKRPMRAWSRAILAWSIDIIGNITQACVF